MIRFRAIALVHLLPALVLCACVPPRAVIVEKAPETKKGKPAEVIAEVPVPPGELDDGIRLPDERLLSMPGDGDFRATTVPSVGPTGPGAVTVRPPTDPPPRPKPKEAEGQ